MATTTHQMLPHATLPHANHGGWSQTALVTFAAVTPLGIFGLVHVMAETMGVGPLFFAPAGLPGWVAAGLHLTILPCLGAAQALVWTKERAGRQAGFWLAGFIAALILLPFVVAPLDSLSLALTVTLVLLLGLATLARVAPVDRMAGFLMAPALGWMGVCAVLGLAMAAAWSPPFALTQGEDAPTA